MVTDSTIHYCDGDSERFTPTVTTHYDEHCHCRQPRCCGIVVDCCLHALSGSPPCHPKTCPTAPAGNATLYQQLAEDLSLAIARGTLPPGARLPSVRRTSQSRQLSLNTVVAAYRVLEDRGLIEARPQSGYYVRARLPSPARPAMTQSSAAKPTESKVLDLIGAVLDAQQCPASSTWRWPARAAATSTPATSWHG
jgi:DNA-binding transcriptional regulator YhcF (GntR family)